MAWIGVTAIGGARGGREGAADMVIVVMVVVVMQKMTVVLTGVMIVVLGLRTSPAASARGGAQACDCCSIVLIGQQVLFPVGRVTFGNGVVVVVDGGGASTVP